MQDSKLNILWASDNPVTAELMVFMYGINSKTLGWWNNVTIIIWGAAADLVLKNEKIQSLVKDALQAGVHVSACQAWAEKLGAVETMRQLGIEVIYWGEPLTEILKENGKLMTI